MLFLSPARRPGPQPKPDPAFWRWLLFGSAAAAALCSMQPWVRVRFEALFDGHVGPPGWHSSAGFTCLCTSALVTVMAIAESGTPASQHAVRPGSLMLVALTTLVLGFQWCGGPGMLRGVSAHWTVWFYLLLASVPVLLTTCMLRWLAAGGRTDADGSTPGFTVPLVRRRSRGMRWRRPRADSRDRPGPDPIGRGSCD